MAVSRPLSLLVVAVLHGATLAALWPGQRAVARPAARDDVAVRLLPDTSRPAPAAAPLRAAPPTLHLPAIAAIAPLAFETMQPEPRPAVAMPVLVAAVAPPPVLPATVPARAEPVAETPLQAARRAACAPAPHPPALRERGIEGVVRLRVWVDELGRAGQVLLAASSGWRLLDDAAVAQARRCPFQPALRGNEPVGSWVEFPVRFALETSSNG